MKPLSTASIEEQLGQTSQPDDIGEQAPQRDRATFLLAEPGEITTGRRLA